MSANRFLRLTNHKEKNIYVNAEYIRAFCINEKEDGSYVALDGCNDSDALFIKETPEEITQLLKEEGFSVWPMLKYPLTAEKISHMVKEAIWDKDKKEWYIIFDYTHGEDGDFVSLIDNNQDMIYMNASEIEQHKFYSEKIEV